MGAGLRVSLGTIDIERAWRNLQRLSRNKARTAALRQNSSWFCLAGFGGQEKCSKCPQRVRAAGCRTQPWHPRRCFPACSAQRAKPSNTAPMLPVSKKAYSAGAGRHEGSHESGFTCCMPRLTTHGALATCPCVHLATIFPNHDVLTETTQQAFLSLLVQRLSSKLGPECPVMLHQSASSHKGCGSRASGLHFRILPYINDQALLHFADDPVAGNCKQPGSGAAAFYAWSSAARVSRENHGLQCRAGGMMSFLQD